MPERRVDSGSASLAVWERGDSAAPTVVLVHGYPDTHGVWEEVASLLAARFHVVAFDTRGVGGSTSGDGDFSLRALADDLGAVLDAVCPDRPVHLVGHDWGAFQCWEALASFDRIASFTALAGPRLDQAGDWALRRLRPWPPALLQVADQARRSVYIGLAQLPALPELATGRLMGDGWPQVMRRLEGIEPRPGHPADTIAADARVGLALYRTNVSLRPRRPAPATVPVQLLVPTRDRYISPALYDDADRWADTVWRRDLRAGHWAQRSHPGAVADAIAQLVSHVEGGPEHPALRRARLTRDRGDLAGRLVVVTGAGSGIGRATALAFVAAGADVIAADIDLETACETGELAAADGGAVVAVSVDVADADAMETFAAAVQADHGVPDVVVNNAGIAVSGPFLDTTRADWERIVGINMWGVVHGSRLFARQMAAAGVAGQIINVASAAAYTPSRMLSAYSTTKAAVLMLSECMRAELAGLDIGVTAICPGVIDTNITRSMTLVGLNPDEADRRRTAAARAYGVRNYSPDGVARAILDAVQTNPAVRPVAPEAYALQVLSRFAPGVLRRLARV